MSQKNSFFNQFVAKKNSIFIVIQLQSSSSPITRYFTWKSCYSKEKNHSVESKTCTFLLSFNLFFLLTYEDTLSIFFFMTHAVIYHIMISLYHVVVNVICVMFSRSYLHERKREGMKIHKFHLFCAVLRFCLHFISLSLTFIYVYFSN